MLPRSLVDDEIEMPSGRGVDLEDLEQLAAEIGERVLHAGGNVHHVVLADQVGLAFDRERALAAFDDVDVVRLGVVMHLAARAARHEPVEMDVDLFGAKARIDELDLLTASRLHRARRTFVEMHDLEHAPLSSSILAAAAARMRYLATVIGHPDGLKRACRIGIDAAEAISRGG